MPFHYAFTTKIDNWLSLPQPFSATQNLRLYFLIAISTRSKKQQFYFVFWVYFKVKIARIRRPVLTALSVGNEFILFFYNPKVMLCIQC
ncbi:hypothetical protein CWB72_00125 [Pseudoalteromonas phenolica]|nr:hypothetical protein CWB72_00125 [Pseudoalteromonas phenolica]